MKYLRVDIEGCVQGCCDKLVYGRLDEGDEEDETLLLDYGQELANEVHTWGCKVVDESEVPEGER